MTSSCKNSSLPAATNKDAMVMNYLPDDVLRNDIFIRLPAKQLALLRSLSKTWNLVLSDSSFIKSHLHHSIHNKQDDNQTEIIAFYFAFLDDTSGTYFTLNASRSSYQEHCNYIKLPPSGWHYVIGSVNGLICFWNYNDVYLWNPCLSSALIPISDSNNTPNISESRLDHSDLRFGFDPKTDDYKVVMVRYYYKMTQVPHQIIDEWLPVEVYSVRKGCWESITAKFPSHINAINGKHVLGDGYDGRVHWLCDVDDPNNNNIKETIVAFDLNLEIFTEISLPPDIVKCTRKRTNVLGVLFQKICVMSCINGGDCEVWVMEDYGVATSWVKRVLSTLYNRDPDLVGFSLRGDLLIRCRDHGLILYDPNTDRVKLLNTRLIDKFIRISHFADYVDSLVWPVAPRGKNRVSNSASRLQVEKE
ncbi:F-box/kelch-repeat protein At3g06240-like [Rutidosis leptorrhynchoides]|uniref:F-box/kelch-repeat protein At3g06240-like n=1 Tax=Rutidosis leptorrhynchoides TaxID=125765 RepID=UPI003A9A6438